MLANSLLPGSKATIPGAISSDAKGLCFKAIPGSVMGSKAGPEPIGQRAGVAMQGNRGSPADGGGGVVAELLDEPKRVTLHQSAHSDRDDAKLVVFVIN